IVCNNLESSCVRSGCGHAWTPRRDFAVSKSVTPPSPSAAWHSKRRAHTESHSAPTPSERVTGRLAVRLALQAVENRVYLSEPVLRVSVSLYTNPPSAGPEAVRRGRDHSRRHLAWRRTVTFPLCRSRGLRPHDQRKSRPCHRRQAPLRAGAGLGIQPGAGQNGTQDSRYGWWR